MRPESSRKTKLILYTDGAARGNPGPAAIGIVLTDTSGKEIEAVGETIGKTTNNEAEYRALLRGLECAAQHTAEVEIRTDSELLARQLSGAYRVRAENLKPLYGQARRAMTRFKKAKIAIIPRELNKRADALANAALDQTAGARPQTSDNKVQATGGTAPILIIISGPPCAGKTTLARRIAQEFRLPLVAKDDVKELLFDSLGWKDREWSKKLGYATFKLLFYFVKSQLAAGRSLIVEANFYTETMTEQFCALQAKYGFVPLQIHCHANSSVLTQRFRARWASGTRHPGHVDDQISEEEMIAILKRYEKALDIGGSVIETDTTDFDKIDFKGLFAEIANLAKVPLTPLRSPQGELSQGREVF